MAQHRALVCGASQGIGAATAHKLAAAGYRVTLLARRAEPLKDLLQQLPGKGHDHLACDLGDPSTYLPALQAEQSKDPYRILLLNTGGPKGGAISKAQPEEFAQAINQHLIAASRLTALVLPAMREARFGRIVTVTSTSVRMPIPHLGVSNTARAAVASWAKTLSFEVAPHQITVNNVMPGYTDTPRLQQLIEAKAKDEGRAISEVAAEWQKSVPMGRFAKPEETADLIAFLVSDQAGYITGQNIAVDGGRLGCL